MRACVILLCNLIQVSTIEFILYTYNTRIIMNISPVILLNIVNYALCLHVTYIANNIRIRIIIILFVGRFHLQIIKTSITTLYLYAFLFILSAWLCDVTFTADR